MNDIPLFSDLCQICVYQICTLVIVSKVIKLCFQLVDPSTDHTECTRCSCSTDVQATDFHAYGNFDAGCSVSNLSQ
jgi:hypothetical protein